MLFDAFDRVRIVSLVERQDRRRQMGRQLAAIGLIGDPKFSFFDAIRMSAPGPFRSSGSHGCYLSHLAILTEAANNRQSVAILQDDCDFLDRIRSYQLPPCDIFYGSHSEDGNTIIGAHFMGFSSRAAALAADYLQQLLDPSFPPDSQACLESGFNPAIRPPIDGSLVWFRRAYPHLQTAFALLGVQRRSRSDITPGALDQIPVVRGAVEAMRRVFA
jgi:glycosyl transferase family 25